MEIYQVAKPPIVMPNKPKDSNRMYWLFYLGEPIPAPDDLDRLKRGKVVKVVEK